MKDVEIEKLWKKFVDMLEIGELDYGYGSVCKVKDEDLEKVKDVKVMKKIMKFVVGLRYEEDYELDDYDEEVIMMLKKGGLK